MIFHDMKSEKKLNELSLAAVLSLLPQELCPDTHHALLV